MGIVRWAVTTRRDVNNEWQTTYFASPRPMSGVHESDSLWAQWARTKRQMAHNPSCWALGTCVPDEDGNAIMRPTGRTDWGSRELHVHPLDAFAYGYRTAINDGDLDFDPVPAPPNVYSQYELDDDGFWTVISSTYIPPEAPHRHIDRDDLIAATSEPI